MKTTLLFLCSFSIFVSLHAESPKLSDGSAERALSLADVTRAVAANNPSIKEARAKWEAMKKRVPQAAAWDDLKVSASSRLGRFVEIMPNSFSDQMLSVEQMIPLSGKNQSRARIAAAEALGALEELRRKELDSVARARTAYFRLARDTALLELNDRNSASLQQTLEISRSRLEVGNETQASVLTAESELLRLTEERHDLLRAASDDATELKVLMNRDPFRPLGKPTVSMTHATPPPTDRLRTLVLSNRPEIRMADAALTAARARLELARREWIPDPALTVEAQRYNNASQAVSELDAGISINVPWLNPKKYRAGESEAKSGVDAAQRALESAKTETLGMLRNQLQKIETFHHHVELFETQLIPNARQTLQTNRTNYEAGKTGFLDLVMSERALREVEATQRMHLADYQTAVAELEALVGADLQLFPQSQPTLHRQGK